ncbi:hypothetical protein BDV06DRAFT_234072 [Aspergillus oleicola]
MSPKQIALPGGTGTIGHSILSALLTPPNPELYKPIILSRATDEHPTGTTTLKQITSLHDKKNYDVETRFVDYTSLPQLKSALKGIHTCISTLLIPGPECVTYQLNLLSACMEVGVRRFAPSEFALPQSSHGLVDVDHGKITVWDEVQNAVKEGKIDAAAFPVGMFMNYLGIGHPNPNIEREARAGFREGTLMFYLASHPDGEDGGGPYAEIPLRKHGEWFPDMTMTDIRDIGRFVVAALGMSEPWGGRELGIAGSTMSVKDISGLFKGIFGERWSEKAVSIAELEERIARPVTSVEDFFKRMETQYVIACGRGGSVVDGVLNRMFPDIKATGIREFVERYWGSASGVTDSKD